MREGQVGAQVVVLRDVDKRKTAESYASPGRLRAGAWDWYKFRVARLCLRITTALGLGRRGVPGRVPGFGCRGKRVEG